MMISVRCVTGSRGGTVVILPVRHIVPEVYRAAADADSFTGSAETTCDIYTPDGRVLLVGLDTPYMTGAIAASHLMRCAHITLDARDLSPKEAAEIAAGICARTWRYDKLRTKPEEDAANLAELDILTEDPKTA